MPFQLSPIQVCVFLAGYVQSAVRCYTFTPGSSLLVHSAVFMEPSQNGFLGFASIDNFGRNPPFPPSSPTPPALLYPAAPSPSSAATPSSSAPLSPSTANLAASPTSTPSSFLVSPSSPPTISTVTCDELDRPPGVPSICRDGIWIVEQPIITASTSLNPHASLSANGGLSELR